MKWVPMHAGSSTDGCGRRDVATFNADVGNSCNRDGEGDKQARAIGTVRSAVNAREGLGALNITQDALSTVAAASCPCAEVAATVRANCVAAPLSVDDPAAEGPPSGRAAPLGGLREDTDGDRPDCTTSQAWPHRLGARPSNKRHALGHEVGDEPAKGVVRRRVGVDDPASALSVARGGADATASAWREEPLKGFEPPCP